MLSEAQAAIVWDGLLSAEIRAQYFAALSVRYQRMQKILVAGSLVLSSGASVTLLLSILPPEYSWIKATLTLATAVCSAATLVMKNERNATECSDLHFRWNNVAMGYQIFGSILLQKTPKRDLCGCAIKNRSSPRPAQPCLRG